MDEGKSCILNIEFVHYEIVHSFIKKCKPGYILKPDRSKKNLVATPK